MLASIARSLVAAVLADAARQATVVDGHGAPSLLQLHDSGAAVGNDAMRYLPPGTLASPEDLGGGDGGGGRSLSLVQVVPSAGQSMFELTKGIHTYHICDTGKDNLSSYKDLYFCNYLNTSIPYLYFPSYVKDESTTGVRQECPDSKETCRELGLIGLSLESCLEWCGNAVPLGDPCSDEMSCVEKSFCRNTPGEEEGGGGICAACPSEPEGCLAEDTTANKKSCLECDRQCLWMRWGETTVDGEVLLAYGLSSAPFYSPTGSVTGPLVDCSDLVLDRVDTCPGAEDSVCLIHDYVKDSFFHILARKCEASGGLAMILYYSAVNIPDHLPGKSYLSGPANIPAVRVSYNDGVLLADTKLGTDANVTTYDAGTDCWIGQYCSTTIPCMADSKYCQFAPDMDVGKWCGNCPKKSLDCLFPRSVGSPLSQNNMKACVAGCAPDLEFGGNCKTCGRIVASSLEFGVVDPADTCRFCPMEDVEHPDRTVPLFSSGEMQIKCWQAQSFFEAAELHKDTKLCKLAQMQNYVCGCEGTGYAGAGTQAKRNALEWVPRTTAILSGLGSMSVLHDVSKVMRRGRATLFHRLMAQMSVFDFVGSVAYAFTSLPIPSENYFQGASGNKATCTAQGFFIQVGTVACYTNVSLAAYYFFVIKKGWSETRLKKVSLWFFVCPILVGMVFAFAGIPFYGNMLLWCNNTAGWWPDIPVAIAIALSTVIMGSVCWDVHKKHEASKRWRQGGGGGGGPSLSSQVFWQSFWYLMSFYMTWPPYLALQYFWASGREYDNYGFILYAGMVVPLQGVWNFFVYARNRQLKRARETISRSISGLTLPRPTLRATLRRSTLREPTTQNSSSPEPAVSQD